MQSSTEKPTHPVRRFYLTVSGTVKPDWVLGAIFLLVTALYAGLMISDRVPTLGLLGLAALWLVYALLGGRLSFATPLDLPILVLLVLLPVSLFISIDHDLSLPKIYGLILGIALFYLTLNAIRDYQRLQLAILALILLAGATALLGLLSANWGRSRFSFLPSIQSRLLGLLFLSAFTPGTREINVNTIGGALTFFVPLLGSLLLDGGAFFRKYLEHKPGRRQYRIAYKLLLSLTLLFVLGILLATFSRSAFVGCAAGILLLLFIKDRRFLWLIPILGVNAVLFFYPFGGSDLIAFFNVLDTAQESTILGRVELWRYAAAMIQDFPLTGGGIFTYSKMLSEVYTFNPFAIQSNPFFHPHNLYLSVAFDLGIPGLVLYMALLSSFVAMAWRTLNRGRSIIKVLIIGLVCGMFGHHAFGVLDANALGTKLGATLWIFLGLMAALYTHKRHRGWRPTSRLDTTADREIILARLLDLLVGLGGWVLISLVAVTFITLNISVGLALALLGGIGLGLFLTLRFERFNNERRAEDGLHSNECSTRMAA